MTNDYDQPTPGWLVDGAEVLIYSLVGRFTGRCYGGVRATTVKKVSTTSFTVHDEPNSRSKEPRIQIRRLQSADYRRSVVPLDSDQAREILARDAYDSAQLHADRAVRAWQHKPTRENRQAAIEALQAIGQHEADHAS